ncbi:ser/Thr protein phosphatase family protein [Biscogniauxia mediterranea]|nr:ser/Thr protein phosphatase family protein [Biscogniauxia mediterranea]
MSVSTKFLIISDTHADDIQLNKDIAADVAIHCGDLTEESKLDEYQKSLQLLQDVNAPLKLVIAGNHDFTLDEPAFRAKVAEAIFALEPELVEREYGGYGEARQLMDQTTGITFLDEGTHHFVLDNGAHLTVYASPYTPSEAGNGFQYSPRTGHRFDIGDQVDVVITHGPPHGVMDLAQSRRAGCPDLFAALARARPRLHCFGHIHEGWGAKLVAWRSQVSEQPSHFTDIDNSKSKVIEKLSNITETKYDTTDTRLEKLETARRLVQKGYRSTSHCEGDDAPLEWKAHTLFVNAAAQGLEGLLFQPPWLVQLELPTTPG